MGKTKREFQRTIAIQLDPKNLAERDGLVLDFNNGKLLSTLNGELRPLVGDTQLEYRRERKNGRHKILHRSSGGVLEDWFCPNSRLLCYDHLIAVDTNTRVLQGSSVSVTAAYHFIPGPSEGSGVRCWGANLILSEFWNVCGKPENHGWWKILQAITQQSSEFSGIIVDSDLGQHEAFNSRQLPIFDDYFLPENLTLIYASDTGAPELVATQLIKHCDNLASELFKEENLLLRSDGLHPDVGPYFSHFRQWDEGVSDLRPFS